YVPLDPQAPPDRLEFILRDSGAGALLTSESLVGRISNELLPVLFLERATHDVKFGDWQSGSPDNLAYVIYTSGSTGRPKGVAVQHRSVVNNLTWRQRSFPLN